MAAVGRILLVDNSRAYAAIVSSAIKDRLGLDVLVADSLSAAAQTLDRGNDGIFLVLSGLILPDADEAAVVSYFVQRKLPLVVVSGVFDTATRERILAQPVIDYVLKDNPASVDYLVWLVDRIRRNHDLTALVVDDSRSYRGQVSGLLSLYGFKVLSTDNAEKGFELLQATPQIKLVVTDFELPGMNGIQFVRRIRALHPRDRLAIIGVSSSQSSRGPVSAQFIKTGANDYLNKPFLPEELFCRVAQNVESLESIASLRVMASTDSLTGLLNRRAFLEGAQRRFETQSRKGLPLAVAMLDVDFFKRINDTRGHDGGDEVLRALARLMPEGAGDDELIGRFGGEEFCILLPGLEHDAALARCEHIRRAIEGATIHLNDGPIPVTASIGLCGAPLASLHAMLKEADTALYRAKAEGRNRVSSSSPPPCL
ncbi:hypothetical protein A6A04_09405 [Paramagnetospirillum marisnigri]|uniref:diguanylate cyclase n=1 Tax=Paramagnetospirillum marisnigri TaxID=1285242 RepID=A0A178M5U6_9PROT|nr:diguanylate cyclase [Paramagnetospirillum marisnigri]OAN42915.1 hypothetical protein A6A04_09405 [Paramagnetospirillum marisnigri]